MNRTILIVEDDNYISTILKSLLEANDYRVLMAETGQSALQMTASHVPEIILLDLGLPDMDGMKVLKMLREWYQGPIVVVSARSQVEEKVKALDMGANDYINKPFNASELLARIRVALRQSVKVTTNTAPSEMKYTVGDLTVDFQSMHVYVCGREIHMTRLEYRIIELLARAPGKVLTHDYIIQSVWGPHAKTNNNLILRVNIANIRRKVEKDHNAPRYILAEIGVGYRMASNDSFDADEE